MTKKAAGVIAVSLLVAVTGGSALLRWRETREPAAEPARSAMMRSVHPPGPSQPPVNPSQSAREESASRNPFLQAETPTSPAGWTPMGLWRETERRAGEDFEAALRWARRFPKDLNRDRALSCLSLCLCGIAGEDALRAVELTSEIQDPALRLHAQGEVARWWAYFQPVNALAWVVSLPERAVPSTPPEDEGERMLYYFSNTRLMILRSCIGAWAAPIRNAEGVNEVPQDKVNAARRWIEEASLYPEIKADLLDCLRKNRK